MQQIYINNKQAVMLITTYLYSKTAGLISEGQTGDRNEDATMMSETSKTTGNVVLRTVTVYLKNGDCKLKTNALLDNASTKTYIIAEVVAELGLQGHPHKVKVKNGQVETFASRMCTGELRRKEF